MVGPCGRVGSDSEGALRREGRGFPASFCGPEQGLRRSPVLPRPAEGRRVVSVSFLLWSLEPATLLPLGLLPLTCFFPASGLGGRSSGQCPHLRKEAHPCPPRGLLRAWKQSGRATSSPRDRPWNAETRVPVSSGNIGRVCARVQVWTCVCVFGSSL